MTAAAVPAAERQAAVPFSGLEVATMASDALRASIRVSGHLTAVSASLLTSVLRTHLMAGRRYLRVDLATALVVEPAVVDALVDVHHTISDLGGMLVFENAGPLLIDGIRTSHLFIRPSTV